jgi:hypothetical protein
MFVFLVIVNFRVDFVNGRYICERKKVHLKISILIREFWRNLIFIKYLFLLDNTYAFIVIIINCLEFIRKFRRNVIFINDCSLDNTVCFSIKTKNHYFLDRTIKANDWWMKNSEKGENRSFVWTRWSCWIYLFISLYNEE